jgi:hypothetical protein
MTSGHPGAVKSKNVIFISLLQLFVAVAVPVAGGRLESSQSTTTSFGQSMVGGACPYNSPLPHINAISISAEIFENWFKSLFMMFVFV